MEHRPGNAASTACIRGHSSHITSPVQRCSRFSSRLDWRRGGTTCRSSAGSGRRAWPRRHWRGYRGNRHAGSCRRRRPGRRRGPRLAQTSEATRPRAAGRMPRTASVGRDPGRDPGVPEERHSAPPAAMCAFTSASERPGQLSHSLAVTALLTAIVTTAVAGVSRDLPAWHACSFQCSISNGLT